MQIALADYIKNCPHFDSMKDKWTCCSESADEKIVAQYNLMAKIDGIKEEHIRFISELARYNNEVSDMQDLLAFSKKVLIRHVFCAFIAWWKLRGTFGRIQEQIIENSRCSQGFPPAWELSQTLSRFSTVYGGTDNMFYFFYKIIIFIVNKEKDDIQSVYCTFSQLGDSQTTLLTPFSCFIALWKHTCKPIKMYVLSKVFYKLVYTIVFSSPQGLTKDYLFVGSNCAQSDISSVDSTNTSM